MLASHDWRLRHAGLMAIAAMGEGGGKVSFLIFQFVNILREVVEVTMFSFD